MSKTKQYFTNEVEKDLDKYTKQYIMGIKTLDQAKKAISNISGLELVLEKENIGDHLYFSMNEAGFEEYKG